MEKDILDIKEEPQVNAEILKEHKRKRRQLVLGILACLAVSIIVVAFTVPVVLLNRRNHSDNQQDTAAPKNETTKPQATTRFYSASQQSLHPPVYAHVVSPYANLTRVKILEPAARRIFVMGDIHGCLTEMNNLLNQIKFNSAQDILILTGDLVYRGEDSMGVIRRAKEIGAYCVRGNHDDKVLRIKNYEMKNGLNGSLEDVLDEGDVADRIKFGNKHASLAKEMNVDEYSYLSGCPLAIDIPGLKARVVHGGLDPFLPNLVDNDPWSVMNMRDMDNKEPSKLKLSKTDNSVENWTEVYSRNNPNNITVFYGHDASRGLVIGKSTVGLDSGCVHGRQLSVMEIQTRQLTQVNCTIRGSNSSSSSDANDD